MFKAVFSALKRAFDLSLAPILMAGLAVLVEWFTGGVTWMIINISDMVVSALAGLLGLISVPPDMDITSIVPLQVLQLADASGFWPAVAVVLLGGVARLVVGVVTLGIVKK